MDERTSRRARIAPAFRLTPIAAALAAAGLLATPFTPARAATITVGGNCTLVDAIASANDDSATGGCAAGYGSDVIVLPANSTQTFSTYLDINSTITIQGNGSTIRVDPAVQSDFTVMFVESGASLTLNNAVITGGGYGGLANYGRATLNDSTITGNVQGGGYGGGGIYNGSSAILTLNRSTVSGNSAAAYGGGIANDGGSVTLNNSTVTGNVSGDSYVGGGIYNTGTLTLNQSTVHGNSSSAAGGGIANYDGTVTLNGSVVSGNSAGRDGGGILNISGALTLGSSVVSGNTAAMNGGGIASYSGRVTVNNSVVRGNRAGDSSPYSGGGIALVPSVYFSPSSSYSTLTLSNSTVSGNRANSGAGIIINSASATLGNSTLSDNSASQQGGGLMVGGCTCIRSSVALSNSTVINNRAGTPDYSGTGGGIMIEKGTLTVQSSTISGNATTGANAGGGGVLNRDSLTIANSTLAGNVATYAGGGLVNAGTMTLSNSTVSGNSASFGGGIYTDDASSTLTLAHSLVSGNSASNGAEIFHGLGAIDSSGTVLGHSGHTSSESFSSFTPDITDADLSSGGAGPTPLTSILSVLGSNGGPTLTMALVPGSPATNASGDNGTGFDQRGAPVTDGQRDAGAFELDAAVDETANRQQSVQDVNGNTVNFTIDNGSLAGLSSSPATFVPEGSQYPNGFFSFGITGLTPGAQVTVTIDLPAPDAGSVPNAYVKCLGAEECSAVPGGSGDGATVSSDGRTITLRITDGGPLDADGEANGMILDPGAPAFLPGGGGSATISGGAFGWLTSLLLAPMAWLRRRRAKR